MRRAALLSALLWALAAPCLGADSEADALRALGERLYLRGLGADEVPVEARAAGDLALPARRAACVSCHRRSGLGSMEGDEVVLPIAGAFLFSEGTDRARAVRLGGGLYGGGSIRERPLFASTPGREKERPAYDLESFARAMREGVSSAGRPLAASMPRYALSDAEVEALAEYLGSMDLAPAEGVSETTIRFATIVAGDGPRSRAVVDVLEAFVRDQSSQNRHDQRRAQKGSWIRQWQLGAYRDWALDIWRLSGGPETWPDQLAAAYERQPVFAVLSGALEAPAGVEPLSWAPIQEFCESRALPCLFPVTTNPGSVDGEIYTAYLAPGLELEAQVALAEAADASEVLQLVEPAGRVGAEVVSSMLGRCGGEVAAFETEAALVDAVRHASGEGRRPAVMLWTSGAAAMAMLAREAEAFAEIGEIFLFDRLGEADLGNAPEALRERLRVVRAYETRDPADRHLLRTTAWLRAKGIAPDEIEAQASAFFASMTVAMALKRMRGLYSREYLLERIEHLVDNSLVTSIYPPLTLGPGQRVASHGAYVLRVVEDGAVERSAWRSPLGLPACRE